MGSFSDTESVRARLDWYKQAILPHEGALRSRLRRVLPDGADVDDVVAEAMTRAYATGDIERLHSGRAYLYQIARNLVVDAARRAKIVSFEVIADLDTIGIDDRAEAGRRRGLVKTGCAMHAVAVDQRHRRVAEFRRAVHERLGQ